MNPLLLIVVFTTVVEPTLFTLKLQGEWKITGLHAMGIDLSDTAKEFSITIQGNVLTLPGGEKSRFAITRISGNQAEVTFFNQYGRPFYGVAMVNKASVEVCWSLKVAGPRPKQVDDGKREAAISFQLATKP